MRSLPFCRAGPAKGSSFVPRRKVCSADFLRLAHKIIELLSRSVVIGAFSDAAVSRWCPWHKGLAARAHRPTKRAKWTIAPHNTTGVTRSNQYE